MRACNNRECENAYPCPIHDHEGKLREPTREVPVAKADKRLVSKWIAEWRWKHLPVDEYASRDAYMEAIVTDAYAAGLAASGAQPNDSDPTRQSRLIAAGDVPFGDTSQKAGEVLNAADEMLPKVKGRTFRDCLRIAIADALAALAVAHQLSEEQVEYAAVSSLVQRAGKMPVVSYAVMTERLNTLLRSGAEGRKE